MTLETREPTGKAAWPLLVVEGPEKKGKSYEALALGADSRIGRCFVFDLGDGTSDEYAELGDYEIVVTDGTYHGFLTALSEVCDMPAEDGKVNAVVIDSGTDLWDLLKDWASHRARNGKAGRRKLADDPDAEVDVSMNLWNDAKDRWARVVNTLRRAPVIGVITAQGKEVAVVQGGSPTGQTTYAVEAEKTLLRVVTGRIQVGFPNPPRLIDVRSLNVTLPKNGQELPSGKAVAEAVFDVIGAGTEFAATDTPAMEVGVPVAAAKKKLLNAVGGDQDRALEEWGKAGWSKLHGDTEVPAGALNDLCVRLASGDVAVETGGAHEGYVLVTDAKTRLLDACGGARARFNELWSGAGWDQLDDLAEVEESELAEICELAKDLGEEA